jgi:hypothetical protein
MQKQCLYGLVLLGFITVSLAATNLASQTTPTTNYDVTIRNNTIVPVVISKNTATKGIQIQSGVLPQVLLINASGNKSFTFTTGANNATTWKLSLNACQGVTSGNNPPCQNTSTTTYICTFNASSGTGTPTANASPTSNNGFGCVGKIIGTSINFTINA